MLPSVQMECRCREWSSEQASPGRGKSLGGRVFSSNEANGRSGDPPGVGRGACVSFLVLAGVVRRGTTRHYLSAGASLSAAFSCWACSGEMCRWWQLSLSLSRSPSVKPATRHGKQQMTQETSWHSPGPNSGRVSIGVWRKLGHSRHALFLLLSVIQYLQRCCREHPSFGPHCCFGCYTLSHSHVLYSSLLYACSLTQSCSDCFFVVVFLISFQ